MTNNKFYDLLLSEYNSDVERNQAVIDFVAQTSDELSIDMAEDLGLWILYGVREVTVGTQIKLSSYKIQKEALMCERA